MKSKNIIQIILVVTLLFNVGCDQISKKIVRQAISYNERIALIDNHLTLTKVENTGAFLSIGNALPEPYKMILLTIFPIIILLFALIYMLTKIKPKTKNQEPKTNNQEPIGFVTRMGIAFIVGGGIGNIYDRVVYGSVTDFLYIKLGVFQTGIFNMADVSIMIGIFVMLLGRYKMDILIPGATK